MIGMEIEELKSTDEHLEELSDLLIQVVEEGASIGFLPPMERAEAICYWRHAVQSDVMLFVAKIDGQIAGSIQLQLCSKQNGNHRAEIAKLMTNPAYRRKGVGRALMQRAEARAKQEGRTLIVLDTREGDPSNDLYRSIAYQQAGRIPGYAKSSSGDLQTTVIYYKNLLEV